MNGSVEDLTCRELVELVTDYLEGRLPPHEQAEFAAHFQVCEACVTYVEQMRQVVAISGEIDEGTLDGPTREAMLGAFRGWKAGSR